MPQFKLVCELEYDLIPSALAKYKMLTKLRRSFRRKKASYCVNCGHVERACYHQEYENVDFHNNTTLNNQVVSSQNSAGTMVASEMRWLDIQAPGAHCQTSKKIMNCDAQNNFVGTNYGDDVCTNEAVYSLPQVIPTHFEKIKGVKTCTA